MPTEFMITKVLLISSSIIFVAYSVWLFITAIRCFRARQVVDGIIWSVSVICWMSLFIFLERGLAEFL